MKKIILLLIFHCVFLHLYSQVIIDSLSLISQEDSMTRFCFNNTKLMAGDSINDRYIVYYNSDTIFLNVNQSGNWTKRIVTVGTNIESATMTYINNTIWVCWKGGAFIKASYSVNKGISWTILSQNISNGGQVGAPSFCASQPGRIHFVWHVNDSIVLYRNYYNGNYSTIDTLSNTGFASAWPTIVSIADTILCAWKERHGYPKVFFTSSFNGGQTWTPAFQPNSLSKSKDPNLAIAYDSVNNLRYTYLAFDSNDKIIIQRSLNYGGTGSESWTIPDTISNTLKPSQFAHLATGNNGFVGVTYEQGQIFGSEKNIGFCFSTSFASLNSFGTDTLAYTNNPMGALYPAIDKIDENNFYISWVTEDTILDINYIYERRIYFGSTNGISESNFENKVIFYPNPSTKNLYFSIPQTNIGIYNLQGVLVKEHIGETRYISIENFPTGFYFIKTNNGTAKFIKTK